LHQNNQAALGPYKINNKILDEIAEKLQIKKNLGMKSPNCGRK